MQNCVVLFVMYRPLNLMFHTCQFRNGGRIGGKIFAEHPTLIMHTNIPYNPSHTNSSHEQNESYKIVCIINVGYSAEILPDWI